VVPWKFAKTHAVDENLPVPLFVKEGLINNGKQIPLSQRGI
jgi:hypothetical protein